jgi:hypothetical protein
MKNKTDEFKNFDRTMRELMKVPHSEIKAKLEAEKATKKKNKTKAAPPQEGAETG